MSLLLNSSGLGRCVQVWECEEMGNTHNCGFSFSCGSGEPGDLPGDSRSFLSLGAFPAASPARSNSPPIHCTFVFCGKCWRGEVVFVWECVCVCVLVSNMRLFQTIPPTHLQNTHWNSSQGKDQHNMPRSVRVRVVVKSFSQPLPGG